MLANVNIDHIFLLKISSFTLYTENSHGTLHPNNDISRHASAHLMEEVVHLWELAVMMPYISFAEKSSLKSRFEAWDKQIIDAAKKGLLLIDEVSR